MHSTTQADSSTAPLLASNLALAGLLALLLAACPGDESTADTEAADTADTEATADTQATADTDVPGTSTTGAVTDDTGEAPPSSTCVVQVGAENISSVYSRDGAPIDRTCDPTPAPCGGDPVGTWRIEAMCGVDGGPIPFDDACPGSTFAWRHVSHSGTSTFLADGTFMEDVVAETAWVVSVEDPMACYGTDCVGMEEMLQQGATEPEPVSCATVGSRCECSTVLVVGEPTTGTWEVQSDTELVRVHAGNLYQMKSFCVADDRLTEWEATYNTWETDVPCEDDQDCAEALGDIYESYSCMEEDEPGVIRPASDDRTITRD